MNDPAAACGPACDLASDLVAVLAVNGVLPRRAVLVGSDAAALGDKRAHPAAPEVAVLSRVCEAVRRARGLPVFPRCTAPLLDLALGENSPEAWAAVQDDLDTGCMDMDAVAAVLRRTGSATALVACLVACRDEAHCVHIAGFLAAALERACDATKEELGRALACQLRAVMDAVWAQGGLMSRRVRDAVLSGFGRVLARVPVPPACVADAVLHALATRRDDMLRMFLHVPVVAFLDHRPQILAACVDRARLAAPASRYPLVALLARMVAAHPEAVAGNEAQLAGLVRLALPADEDVECREVAAAAALAVAAGGCGNDLAMCLARSLRSCAFALLAT